LGEKKEEEKVLKNGGKENWGDTKPTFKGERVDQKSKRQTDKIPPSVAEGQQAKTRNRRERFKRTPSSQGREALPPCYAGIKRSRTLKLKIERGGAQ